jgi:twitching motility protein PilT
MGSATIQALLQTVFSQGASDLHLKVGRPPLMRLKGDVVPMDGFGVLEAEDLAGYLKLVVNEKQWIQFQRNRELDFSFLLKGLARFRGNAFFQRGQMGAAFRLIPAKIPTLEELLLPPGLKDLVEREQGFFLVTGPTGSGKSTTLAALIDHINNTRPVHVITLEDPIEFVYEDRRAVINQREVGSDTSSFAEGLRHALRQDPDVILIGEMRDIDTMSTAMHAAETGHLVLGTLHTNDAKQAVDRVIDMYPPEAQNQIRMQLAKCLLAVVAQRLLKRADNEGRVPLMEILVNSPTVQKLIEDNKVGALAKAIEDSATFYKMQSFNQALLPLIVNRTVTVAEALAYSNNPNDLKIRLQTDGILAPQAPESAGR